MWLVVTRFNTFYLAEEAIVPKAWTVSVFGIGRGKKKERKWAELKNCWMVSRNKKLFYAHVSVDMKYVDYAEKIILKNFNKFIQGASYKKLVGMMRKWR